MTSRVGGQPFQEGGAASDTERRASLFIFDPFTDETCSYIDECRTFHDETYSFADEDTLFTDECRTFPHRRCSFFDEDALIIEECGTFRDKRASFIAESIIFTAERTRFTAESGPFSPERALDGHEFDTFTTPRAPNTDEAHLTISKTRTFAHQRTLQTIKMRSFSAHRVNARDERGLDGWWGAAPRGEDGLRITTRRTIVGIRTKGIGRSRSTTRPPAGAEGSGCTVYQRGWWHLESRLKGLAPRAACGSSLSDTATA